MATAHQIRELIAQTTTGTARPRVPREVRDEVCRYAVRRRKAGGAWALIARDRPRRAQAPAMEHASPSGCLGGGERYRRLTFQPQTPRMAEDLRRSRHGNRPLQRRPTSLRTER